MLPERGRSRCQEVGSGFRPSHLEPDTWNLTFLGEEDGCVSCSKRVLRWYGFILQGEI
jgi:hypothetical protein